MKKTNNSILNSKFVKWYVIPFLLIVAWAILTLFAMINYDESFLELSYSKPTIDFTNIPTGPMLKGQKIVGQFVANENDLGIVSIRFQQKLRIPYQDEDQLIFRIKEQGSSNWFYQGKYMSGLTFDVPFLPFGFPVIHNSKGKVYIFELLSLRGNEQNGIEISNLTPNLVTKYKFTKNELMTNKKELLLFIGKKLLIAAETPDILLSSFVYLMPLILYIIMLVMRLKRMYASYISLLLLLIIIYDIFQLQSGNDILYMMGMVVWVISLRMQHRTSIYTFEVGILFLLLVPLLYMLGDVTGALKASSWIYAFFVAGTMQVIFVEKTI